MGMGLSVRAHPDTRQSAFKASRGVGFIPFDRVIQAQQMSIAPTVGVPHTRAKFNGSARPVRGRFCTRSALGICQRAKLCQVLRLARGSAELKGIWVFKERMQHCVRSFSALVGTNSTRILGHHDSKAERNPSPKVKASKARFKSQYRYLLIFQQGAHIFIESLSRGYIIKFRRRKKSAQLLCRSHHNKTWSATVDVV